MRLPTAPEVSTGVSFFPPGLRATDVSRREGTNSTVVLTMTALGFPWMAITLAWTLRFCRDSDSSFMSSSETSSSPTKRTYLFAISPSPKKAKIEPGGTAPEEVTPWSDLQPYRVCRAECDPAQDELLLVEPEEKRPMFVQV